MNRYLRPGEQRARLVLLSALGVLLLSAGLAAQRRSVGGLLTDSSGAPLAGVRLELVLDGTVERATQTDDGGAFRFSVVDLSRGAYQVRLPLGRGGGDVVAITAEPRQVTVGSNYRLEIRTGSLASAARSTRPSSPPPATAGAEPPAPAPPAAPPPVVLAPPPGNPPAPTISAPDPSTHVLIPVFYATDRDRVSYAPLAYGGQREPANELHLGRIDVSVPRDHQVGQLERPTVWTFWREDPAKHFIIVKASEQSYADFYRDVADTVGRSPRKEALVFVHGFNVSFESAVYRTAQVAYDLSFDGAPILYSWPSVGTAAGYPVDANNSEWTIDHLHWFLEDLAARSGAQYIHLIAHSRGNGPLMNALNAIASEPNLGTRPRFSQIVLTAPDVDADRFRVLARNFRRISNRTTLYASANDEALALSKQYQGYQRAGDVRPEIVSIDGVDSIDVSAVDTSFLGHSYYGDNASVISDIRRLLRTGLDPDRRCGIQLVTSALLRYWTFVARTVCPAG